MYPHALLYIRNKKSVYNKETYPKKPALGTGNGLSEGAGNQFKDSVDGLCLHLTDHAWFYGFLNQLVVPTGTQNTDQSTQRITILHVITVFIHVSERYST